MQNKKELVQAMHEKMEKNQAIVVAGVDQLEQVRCCQEADCDLILLYPTSKYEKAKNRFLAGFLAFGNTNEMMQQVAGDVMPIVGGNNILAGLNGSDPFKLDRILLKRMKEHHFAGIHNYPPMSLVDGIFEFNMSNLKLGFDEEVQLLKKAGEEGFYTCAMVRTSKQAILMARANVDMIVFYLGLGEKEQSQRQSKEKRVAHDIEELKVLAANVRKVAKDIPLLFHSERVNTVDERKMIMEGVPEINGYCMLPVAKQWIEENQLKRPIRNSRYHSKVTKQKVIESQLTLEIMQLKENK